MESQLKVKVKTKQISNSLDNAMQTGLKILDIARSGAGKSVLMFQMIDYLLDNGLIEVCRIIIFSKTVKSDPTQVKFIKKATKLYEKYRDKKNREDTYENSNVSENIQIQFLVQLFDAQKKAKDNGKHIYPYLIVFDDMISQEIISQKNQQLVDLATIGRHYLVHSCWLLQSYRSSINPIIRRQANVILLGHVTSDNDVEDVLSEFSSGVADKPSDRKRITMEWYREAIRQHNNHGFLRINAEVPFGEGRFQLSNDPVYFDV